MMGIYYRCYHPSGAIYILTSRKSVDLPHPVTLETERDSPDTPIEHEHTMVIEEATVQQDMVIRHEVMSIDMGYSSDLAGAEPTAHRSADHTPGYTIDTSLR